MAITVIRDVRLFDGNNLHQNSTITFNSETGTIKSISSSNESIPPGANVIDGAGHTLLPGLIDSHVHVHALHLPVGGDHGQVLRQPLKCGVTTICDMHSDPETIHKFWKEIQEEVEKVKAGNGKIELVDLKSSLYGATIHGGWPKPVVLGHNPTDELKAIVDTWPSVTPETAADFVKNHKSNGADYIKLMQENCCSLAMPDDSIPVASVELQTSVVKAAHDADLLVVGHATARVSTEIVLEAGADGLTHTFIDQSPKDDLVPLYKKNNAFVIPTLVILSSLTGELSDYREKFRKIAADLGIADDFTQQNMVEFLGGKSKTATVDYAFETVRFFQKHGIDVVAGTDSAAGLKGSGIGPSLWMELSLYVEKCGMSIMDALRSATSVSAKRFKFTDRGTIEPGKRADLLLVKGDPTTQLQDLWQKDGIVGVWKQGLRAV